MNYLKKNATAFGLFVLAGVLAILAWVFYNTSKQASQTVVQATQGTKNIDELAGKINNVLSSVGIN